MYYRLRLQGTSWVKICLVVCLVGQVTANAASVTCSASTYLATVERLARYWSHFYPEKETDFELLEGFSDGKQTFRLQMEDLGSFTRISERLEVLLDHDAFDIRRFALNGIGALYAPPRPVETKVPGSIKTRVLALSNGTMDRLIQNETSRLSGLTSHFASVRRITAAAEAQVRSVNPLTRRAQEQTESIAHRLEEVLQAILVQEERMKDEVSQAVADDGQRVREMALRVLQRLRIAPPAPKAKAAESGPRLAPITDLFGRLYDHQTRLEAARELANYVRVPEEIGTRWKNSNFEKILIAALDADPELGEPPYELKLLTLQTLAGFVRNGRTVPQWFRDADKLKATIAKYLTSRDEELRKVAISIFQRSLQPIFHTRGKNGPDVNAYFTSTLRGGISQERKALLHAIYDVIRTHGLMVVPGWLAGSDEIQAAIASNLTHKNESIRALSIYVVRDLLAKSYASGPLLSHELSLVLTAETSAEVSPAAIVATKAAAGMDAWSAELESAVIGIAADSKRALSLRRAVSQLFGRRGSQNLETLKDVANIIPSVGDVAIQIWLFRGIAASFAELRPEENEVRNHLVAPLLASSHEKVRKYATWLVSRVQGTIGQENLEAAIDAAVSEHQAVEAVMNACSRLPVPSTESPFVPLPVSLR